MAKDPAFLFYPNDWLGGTLGMTFDEKGAYMELLMLQFNRGHMTSHMIGHTVGQLWDKIKDKFIQDDHGLWYNYRLEVEKNKRKKYSESRMNNKNGINQYTNKDDLEVGHMTSHMTTHMTSHMISNMIGHMENENININIEDKKGGVGGKKEVGKFIKPTIQQISEYCKERKNKVDPNKFFDFYESKGWMIGKNKMKDWKASVRTWEKESNNNPLPTKPQTYEPVIPSIHQK